MNTATSLNDWISACGGTEQPFVFQGKHYLYMWNRSSKVHAYYCITDEVFADDDKEEQLWNRGH